MDRSHTLLLAAASVLLPAAASHAQATAIAPDALRAIHERLLRAPAEEIDVDGARYLLVNDRHEAIATRKAARKQETYVMRIAPARHGWSVRVLSVYDVVLMDGTSLDPDGQVLDGDLVFRDEDGRLRAEGRYDHGRKTGVWHRYTARGEQLPDKTYYAEDWDGMQVRVGLASMCCDLGDTTASGAAE